MFKYCLILQHIVSINFFVTLTSALYAEKHKRLKRLDGLEIRG